jgi:hypothetical protein
MTCLRAGAQHSPQILQRDRAGMCPSSAGCPAKCLPANLRAATWGADAVYLQTSRGCNAQENGFPLSFRKGKRRLNALPFSELKSNDPETLPPGAPGTEQSNLHLPHVTAQFLQWQGGHHRATHI